MQDKIRIVSWDSLTHEQKLAAMNLIDEKIPSLGKYTTIFLQKALDKKINRVDSEEDTALVALEEEKVKGIVVGRKDLRRKQLWIRFIAGSHSRGVLEYVKKHKTTPVVQMIKRMIRRGEKERFEPMIEKPRTNAGKAVVAKRIQKMLPKPKRLFRLR
jgi:hypothetical protein